MVTERISENTELNEIKISVNNSQTLVYHVITDSLKISHTHTTHRILMPREISSICELFNQLLTVKHLLVDYIYYKP